MLIFIESGRIGNQLFQYCGFKKYFPDHKLVFIGCEDINNIFGNIDAIFIKKEEVKKYIPLSLLIRILNLFVKLKMIGTIKENTNDPDYKLIVNKGIFRLFATTNIYFQHSDFIKNISFSPTIKTDLMDEALYWLKSKSDIITDRKLLFVHIRRGDYLEWPSRNYPAVLNLAWYKKAMEIMESRYTNPVFIVMGDDHYYLYDVFKESESLIISKNTPRIDITIMSLCHGGILSASTFAWWGAFMSRMNSSCEQEKLFLAPKYWAGHRLGKWYPKNFISSWITYIDTEMS